MSWAALATRRVRRALLIATAAGGLVMAAITFTKPAGLFSGDEGVKLVQTLSVIEHGVGDPSMTYAGERFDPTHRHFAFWPPFVLEHDHEIYGIYPIVFTAPSAAGYAAFGFWGLYLLPLFAGIWALHATLRLAVLLTGRLAWGLATGALLVIATPLALNAALFNEHAPATACVLAGLLAIANPARRVWRDATAGLALGLAMALRPEVLALAPAVPLFAVLARGWDRSTRTTLAIAGAAALALLAAVAVYNVRVTGHVLPSLTTNLATAPDPVARESLFYDPWTFAASPIPPALLLVAVGVAGVIAQVAAARPVVRGAALGAAAIAIVGVTVLAALALRGITPGGGARRHTIGMFTTTPLLLIGLLAVGDGRDERHRLRRASWAFAIAGMALIAATDVANDGGLQLGARYLLPIVPILLALAVAWIADHARVAAAVALAIATAAVSVAADVSNHRSLVAMSGKSAALVRAARAGGGRDLVTDFRWVPQLLAPLWETHNIYLAPQPDLLIGLAQQGSPDVTQVLGGLDSLKGQLGPATVVDAERGVIRYALRPAGAR